MCLHSDPGSLGARSWSVREIIEALNYCTSRYLKSLIPVFLLAKFSRKWTMEINVFKAILENGTERGRAGGFGGG